jgi:hypothetical protein
VKKQIHPFVDETDLHILLTLGNGNMTEGVRVCVAWAQHFYNIGLRDDLNLDHIGLAVRVNPKQTLDWEDWEAIKNAHSTDLNALQDDFEWSDDM